MPEHTECDSLAVRRPPYLRLWALALLVVAVAAFWWFSGRNYLSLHKLAEHREPLRAWVGAHALPAIGAYIAAYAVTVALSLPGGIVFSLTGGFLFGWLIGGMAALVAATVGAVAIFLLARGVLAEPLARRCGPRMEKLRNRFHDHAISFLLFLRLVPAFPFWLVNLAPAIFGMRLRDYVIATFLGMIPGTFAFALAGAGLDSVLAAHHLAYQRCIEQNSSPNACSIEVDHSSLLTPELLIAFAVLGVVALLPTIVKRLWWG